MGIFTDKSDDYPEPWTVYCDSDCTYSTCALHRLHAERRAEPKRLSLDCFLYSPPEYLGLYRKLQDQDNK